MSTSSSSKEDSFISPIDFPLQGFKEIVKYLEENLKNSVTDSAKESKFLVMEEITNSKGEKEAVIAENRLFVNRYMKGVNVCFGFLIPKDFDLEWFFDKEILKKTFKFDIESCPAELGITINVLCSDSGERIITQMKISKEQVRDILVTSEDGKETEKRKWILFDVPVVTPLIVYWSSDISLEQNIGGNTIHSQEIKEFVGSFISSKDYKEIPEKFRKEKVSAFKTEHFKPLPLDRVRREQIFLKNLMIQREFSDFKKI